MTYTSINPSEFKLNVPEYYNFTTDIIEKWAQDPERVALVVVDTHGDHFEEFTFANLADQANRFLQVLHARGIGKGDRVVVVLPRIHEWYIAVLAMIKGGILPIPTTSQCTPRDLVYRLLKSSACAVITDMENVAKFDSVAHESPELKHQFLVVPKNAHEQHEIPAKWTLFHDAIAQFPNTRVEVPKTRSDDPMLLYFTSGTVAYPKIVLHTQSSYGIAHEITSRFWHDLRPGDLHWTITDTGWAKTAWGALFGQWILGARVLIHNCPRFEAKVTLRILQDRGVTSFCAPPTVYRMLVHEDLKSYHFGSLRHCTSAGEPLNPEILRVWLDSTGMNIYDGYGQTETVNVLANLPGMTIKPGSMGKPTPGHEMAVLDEAGNPLPTGQVGQIALRIRPNRPVGLFAGYWNEPELTQSVFSGDWYLTGDKAQVDEDGYFWFFGRNDDVIITSGYRIGPFEVENALIEHPAVLEAAAVASPDHERGEIVKAFVVLVPGHEGTPELVKNLQQYVREVTAPYKYPRKIEFVESLPKTISGKIRRCELKQKEWENVAPNNPV
jgi:acyl-coenzyme A synthetase/AMP-(fatty) acid ligase